MPKETTVGCHDERRELNFRAEVVDEEKRLVRLTASSEHPVLRYDWREGEYYDEILSHDSKDVDLSRLQDGGPILDRHRGDQIAVVRETGFAKDATRDGKQCLELLVEFSKVTPRAQVIYQDVLDDIRKNVSVGY